MEKIKNVTFYIIIFSFSMESSKRANTHALQAGSAYLFMEKKCLRKLIDALLVVFNTT